MSVAVQPYRLYIDGMEIPITPSKIKDDVKGKNEVLELLNGESYSVIKKSKLEDYSFSFYAFSHEHPGVDLFIPQDEIIEKLKSLKREKKVFEFIVLRTSSDVTLRNSICEYMKLEDYTIDEDHKYGTNNLITLKLQEYTPLGTIKLTEKGGESATKKLYKEIVREGAKVIPVVPILMNKATPPLIKLGLGAGLVTDKFKELQAKKRSDKK